MHNITHCSRVANSLKSLGLSPFNSLVSSLKIKKEKGSLQYASVTKATRTRLVSWTFLGSHWGTAVWFCGFLLVVLKATFCLVQEGRPNRLFSAGMSRSFLSCALAMQYLHVD
jgi:hypothetical protein